jgi:hypothetical protein
MDTNITKMDYDLLHFLPFKPSIRRIRGFDVVRNYGNGKMELSADWTLNYYDLITFAQLLAEYNKEKYNLKITGTMGDEEFKTDVVELEVDIEKLTKLRELSNNKHNRKSIKDSIDRLFSIKLKLETETSFITTRYIYHFKADKEYKTSKIYFNKGFIEHCLKSGLLFNYGRLMAYNNKGYATLLDAYIQSTKTKTLKTYKKSKNDKDIYEYEYKKSYKNEELLEKLFLNELNKKDYDKQKIMENAFKIIHKIGKLPLYKYNKLEKIWIRQDIIQGVLNV